MGDYASKGVAGTALGLGIAGTVGTVAGLMNNGGCGLLGNIFGGNCGCNGRMGAELQYVSQLQAENAMLKAENYSDKVAKETYMQSLADNRALRDELYAFIKPLAEEAANNRVNIATLAADQKCCCEKQELREQILVGKINEVALATKGSFDALNQTISCLSNSLAQTQQTLADITSIHIPLCKVCPEPMRRFNSWATPTAQAPSCQACSSTQAAA